MFSLKSVHRLASTSEAPTLLMLAYREHRDECNTCNLDELCDTAQVLLTAVGHENDREAPVEWNPRSW